LATLCSILEDLSPHLRLLMEAHTEQSEKERPGVFPFASMSAEDIWGECPLPIREFIFEKGLLFNTSRDSSDSLRKGFLWTLVLRNKSSHVNPPLSQLLSFYMRLNRSQSNKQIVLSKLRITSSRTTVDKLIPQASSLAESEETVGAEFVVAAFDNHQQQLSMSGNTGNASRSPMVHSVTRSLRVIPSIPLGNFSAERPSVSLSRNHFLATPKEKFQMKESQIQLLSFTMKLLQANSNSNERLSFSNIDFESLFEPTEEGDEETQEGGRIDPAFPIEESIFSHPPVETQSQGRGRGCEATPGSSFPPLYRRPSEAETPGEIATLFPEAAEAKLFEGKKLLTGKSTLKLMPQLQGKSEDTQMVRSVLRSLLQEMDSRGQETGFLMCDEKLFTIAQNFCKAPPFSRITLLLDPFHLGWNLEKAIYSVFSECGLREILASAGLVTAAQFSFVRDCHDVRRSHHLLVEVALALESELLFNFLRDHEDHSREFWGSRDPASLGRDYFDRFEAWKEGKASVNKRFSSSSSPSFALVSLIRRSLLDLSFRVSMWMMFLSAVKIAHACWWGQRSCNWTLIMASLKMDTGSLPFFPAWGRSHYQTALPSMLRDLSKLSPLEEAYLELGAALGLPWGMSQARVIGAHCLTSRRYITGF